MRHNLPRFPTPFIGRAKEIIELSQLLDNPDCCLLTLVGPGGIGKTRLAIEIAHSKLDDFSNGIYFVPLQPLQFADQVLNAIIDTLPLHVTGDPEQQLLDYLSDKHMLLIMDNFEHVLESAPLVSQILAAAPQVTMLVTSREILKLQGEWVRMVEGLPYPENGAVENAAEYSAVELLVESARHLRADFSLAGECEPVIEICQLVEGMPLALELAAGWTTALSCVEIVGELRRGLEFLSSETRDLPARHRSMQAVFDHSWRLLAEEEQAVMQRFAVFRGGCTREAVERVAGATLKVLAGLVAKSMLRHDPERGRYDVQELLRQYAYEHLVAADECDAAPHAHCRYYAEFMAQRGPDVKGGRQLAALNEIKADWNNVQAAWVWALEHRDWDAIGQMMETLHLFCDMCARYFEGATLFQTAVEVLAPVKGEKPHPLWGELLVRAAEVLSLPESEAVADRVTSLLDRAEQEAHMGDDPLYLWVRGRAIDLGAVSLDALPLLEASLAGFRARDDRYYMARVLRWMAYMYSNLIFVGDGDNREHVEQAAELNQQHLELTREIGDESGMAHSLFYMGTKAALYIQLEQAERYLRKASSIWAGLKDRKSVTVVNHWLSLILYLCGDFDQAKSLIAVVLQAASEVHFPWINEVALDLLGQIACLDGDYLKGRDILKELPSPDPRPPRSGLLFAECGLGDFQSARQSLRPALAWCVKHPFPAFVAEYVLVAAILLAHDGEAIRATEVLGLTFGLPKCATGWMEKWVLLIQLRERLERELGPDAYAAAWERGAKRDLQTLTAELLAYFDSDHETAQNRANQSLAEPLTERELEVLALLAQGRSNRQIADGLMVAVGTVKRYVYDICQKLDAENRTHAVARARELGLVA